MESVQAEDVRRVEEGSLLRQRNTGGLLRPLAVHSSPLREDGGDRQQQDGGQHNVEEGGVEEENVEEREHEQHNQLL
jgi:hypothetical protein